MVIDQHRIVGELGKFGQLLRCFERRPAKINMHEIRVKISASTNDHDMTSYPVFQLCFVTSKFVGALIKHASLLQFTHFP